MCGRLEMRHLPCSLLLAVCVIKAVFAEAPCGRDLYSDTWVATDGVGRTMPDYATVGPVKIDHRRVVGIFYVTWHSDDRAKSKQPYAADVSRILTADPKARLDANHPLWSESTFHWGEPELGYFLSKDRYVIRKDMSMLADAGVDVIILDATNGICYWDQWEVVFSEMRKMKEQGNRVPAFCFWAFNGPVITVVQDLFDNIYKKGRYKDLWFYWDDKPLLLYNATPFVNANAVDVKNPNPHYDASARIDARHPHYGDPAYTEQFYSAYTREVKNFFTLRTMWWGYYEWAGKRFVGTEDNWSFGYELNDDRVKALKPDQLVSRHHGCKEEAAVTPAQHASSFVGKSWTRERGEPQLDQFDLPRRGYVPWLGRTVKHPEAYGIYFQQRWDEAVRADPHFICVNDWNEWTAGKYQPQPDHTFPFMRRASTYYFVDQYNAEFNRSIQPMKEGYADNYYMQMAQNIRRYKGVRTIPVLRGLRSPTVNGHFADWAAIDLEYRDTIGDVVHRDYPGYGGQRYTDDSGRNDVVAAKVAVDKDNVYFYVRTNDPLTPHTGRNWMLLLIDADGNAATGWNGYDFLVNEKILDDKTTTLLRYDAASPANPWVEQARLSYRYAGNQIEFAVPRKLLHLTGPSFTFDFHWNDNPTDLHSLTTLRTTGDSAPNGRFNYRCLWKQD
jgi:hypothetical protein